MKTMVEHWPSIVRTYSTPLHHAYPTIISVCPQRCHPAVKSPSLPLESLVGAHISSSMCAFSSVLEESAESNFARSSAFMFRQEIFEDLARDFFYHQRFRQTAVPMELNGAPERTMIGGREFC
jgi:hypothetical protein